MPTLVTVPGATNTVIVNPYSNTFNTTLAQQISATLFGLQGSSNLLVENYSPSLAPPPSGVTGELAVTTDANSLITVPAGFTFTAIGPAIPGGPGPTGPFTVSGATSLFVGDQQVSYFGSAATATVSIAAGNGNDLFSLPTGTNYVIGLGNGNDTVYASGAGTVVGGTGNNLIFANNGPNDILSNGANDTINAATGATTLTTSGADPLIFGGSGTLVYIGNAAGNATVFGPTTNTGSETLFGAAGQDITYQDDGTTVPGAAFLASGTGNETLNAGGSSVGVGMAAGSGSVDMIGSSGPDTFFGGAGAATMAAGTGTDGFIFGNTAGHTGGTDLITGFTSNDTFVLAGYGLGAAAGVLANTDPTAGSSAVVGGSVVVSLTDGTTITFSGVDSQSLIKNASF
jgi:Ca2+-binding RTX toxin-like protein